jgi:hypothetical protein
MNRRSKDRRLQKWGREMRRMLAKMSLAAALLREARV